MNLLDIRTRTWSEICMETTAPHLDQLLGAPVPSSSVLVRLMYTGPHWSGLPSLSQSGTSHCLLLVLQGPISCYFVHRYGFSDSCSVVAFTGDNPGKIHGEKKLIWSFIIILSFENFPRWKKSRIVSCSCVKWTQGGGVVLQNEVTCFVWWELV